MDEYFLLFGILSLLILLVAYHFVCGATWAGFTEAYKESLSGPVCGYIVTLMMFVKYSQLRSGAVNYPFYKLKNKFPDSIVASKNHLQGFTYIAMNLNRLPVVYKVYYKSDKILHPIGQPYVFPADFTTNTKWYTSFDKWMVNACAEIKTMRDNFYKKCPHPAKNDACNSDGPYVNYIHCEHELLDVYPKNINDDCA